MSRHCINTLRGIVKCRANSTTTTIIAVRQVKPFEVGRERGIVVWQMRCVYYCFVKCSEFSLKYGGVVVEFSRLLVGPDVIGQDAEGSSYSVFGFRAICENI
ncbi:hypothetical protein AVEN_71322-1 [Araneus ventricosus]|uniref:Uncharacterized protein n=1 Tax=Araneus ventricosus TaxID=182803 RepID=A0A4Y2BHX8_ARAVE|nr:hypothetical protein AVEN_71322-1 [Araneus ventricosus]